MGLKGSRDAGLDETEDNDGQPAEQQSPDTGTARLGSENLDQETTTESEDSHTANTPSDSDSNSE